MHNFDVIYKKIIKKCLRSKLRDDRTGIGTYSIFGYQYKVDLRKGFPLLTLKKTDFEAIKAELFWFLSGSTNIKDLPEKYRFIWKPWSDEDGEVWFSYGEEWVDSDRWLLDDSRENTDKKAFLKRSPINQIDDAIGNIKNNPYSRQIIVSSWNTANLKTSKFYPCHVLQQYYVDGKYLDLQMYQRSCDVGIGLPYNTASYSLLLSMIAQECNLIPRYFIHSIGDLHVYQNHKDQLIKLLDRDPKNSPKLLGINKSFWGIRSDDCILENYQYHPFIKLKVAI